MCRLLAYKGVPILLSKLIFEPKNSLVHQSYGAQEIEEPLNGDGFGVGWYDRMLGSEPAVFVSMTPAWSNRNLKNIATKIKSDCIFAHVRAASVGDSSESNCHPFHFKQFMMMHNGGVGGFEKIKRKLRRGLSDEIYDWVKGETDSQHLFALFLDKITKIGEAYTDEDMTRCLTETVNEIEKMKIDAGVTETSYLNLVVSDGRSMVATRFISSNEEEALSLYYSTGSRYICEEGVCRMEKADASEHAAMIVSEKLTDFNTDWHQIPENHLVLIRENITVSVRPVNFFDKALKSA